MDTYYYVEIYGRRFVFLRKQTKREFATTMWLFHNGEIPPLLWHKILKVRKWHYEKIQ